MSVQFDREVIGSGYNISKINTNFERIQTALEEAFSRAGTSPNYMEGDLDLNSNDVLNGGAASFTSLLVNGQAVSGITELSQLEDVLLTGLASGDVLRWNGTVWANFALPVYALPGANTDITSLLGITGGIGTADYLDFDTAATPSTAVGRFMWDSTVGSLTLGMVGGNVSTQVGNQMYAYVTNAEATTISKGQPVYMFGAQGDRLSVKLAYNTSDAYSAKTLGLAAEDIAAGQTGYIITQGVLKNVNTAAYSPGDTLYLGATAGTLTATKPYAPNHLVYIGTVARANSGGGEIYVRPQNGYELDEIHDVSALSPTNGDTIRWNSSTSLWEKFPLLVMGGDFGSGGASGLVPAQAIGDGSKFLRGDGTWQVVAGTGTVTSVSVTSNNGFAGTVSNATTTPAITLSTTVTGVLKGDGTAISAATAGTDFYAPGSTDVAIIDGGTGASTAADARTNLGLGTGDSPQFTGIELGNINDTTITRVSAGDIAVEGSIIYRAGGTDVPVADGGTGASTAAGARTNLGLGTADSPQFTGIELGNVSDTTLTRVSAGEVAIEGNTIYRVNGTDVALADGGTGASLTDPNADRMLFWDDSAGAMTWLAPGTTMAITGTTIDTIKGLTLLGTLTTTSGTTQTLTGIASTYEYLYIEIDAVSFGGTNTLALATSTNGTTFGTAVNITSALASSGNVFNGFLILGGIQMTTASVKTALCAISNNAGTPTPTVAAISANAAGAVTAIRFSGGTFDAGTIRIYGAN